MVREGFLSAVRGGGPKALPNNGLIRAGGEARESGAEEEGHLCKGQGGLRDDSALGEAEDALPRRDSDAERLLPQRQGGLEEVLLDDRRRHLGEGGSGRRL